MISMTYKKYEINLNYFTFILFNVFNDLEGENGFYSTFSRGQQGVAYVIQLVSKEYIERNKRKGAKNKITKSAVRGRYDQNQSL